MDIILERISTSPPSASQIGNHADFLLHLQRLELRNAELNVGVYTTHPSMAPQEAPELGHPHGVDHKVSSALVQLVDEGIALRIFNSSDGEDYLQSSRDSTASLQTPKKAIDPVL